MPSRPVVALIVAFWFAAFGWSFTRDIWPRIAATGPPPIAVDLSDEATQFLPIRWKVLRGDKEIGKLTTKMSYQDSDDTFEFTSQFKDLRIEVLKLEIAFPEVTTKTRVTRSGSLREQSMTGKLTVAGFQSRMRVEGRNDNGTFVGWCELDSPLMKWKDDLAPVPVPEGHALNPLQPVNRIVNIRPGQRWRVRAIDPLGDALEALFKQKFGNALLAGPETEPLEAEVGSSTEPLQWGRSREVAECWVIAYRSGDARAKTWVRASDGKVLRQEAFLMGDHIALEREE